MIYRCSTELFKGSTPPVQHLKFLQLMPLGTMMFLVLEESEKQTSPLMILVNIFYKAAVLMQKIWKQLAVACLEMQEVNPMKMLI